MPLVEAQAGGQTPKAGAQKTELRTLDLRVVRRSD
jgi:hypothetical protein